MATRREDRDPSRHYGYYKEIILSNDLTQERLWWLPYPPVGFCCCNSWNIGSSYTRGAKSSCFRLGLQRFLVLKKGMETNLSLPNPPNGGKSIVVEWDRLPFRECKDGEYRWKTPTWSARASPLNVRVALWQKATPSLVYLMVTAETLPPAMPRPISCPRFQRIPI